MWDTLLPQTVSSEHFVARAALDSFSLLTLIHDKLDVTFLNTLLCSLATNIVKVPSPSPSFLIVSHRGT